MRKYEYDGSESQTILTGMIVSDVALSRIADRWEPGGLFAARPENILAGLCVKYFGTTGKAPGAEIEAVFRSWAERKERDRETVEVIGRLLAGLDGKYADRAESINAEYVTGLACQHFNRVRNLKLADEIKVAYEMGRADRAEELVSRHRRVEIGPPAGADLLNDEGVQLEAFKIPDESIIPYPGAAKQFFNRALGKGCLVSLMGPPKMGKTWVLLDMAWRAAMARRRTVFLEVGDMTQPQIVRRFATRAAQRPFWPKKIRWPKSVKVGVDDRARVDFEEIEYDSGMSKEELLDGFRAAVRRDVKSKEKYLELQCHPAGTVTVQQICNMVEDWCQSGWVPDVIVIDYADLLAPPAGSRDDFRHRVNAVWEGLRKLSTSGCQPLVLTATQANRESFGATVTTMKHVSEDMRKLAHVTGIIGLSSREWDKPDGILRLNWTPLREDEFNSHHCVIWAGCLSIGNPCVQSCFKDMSFDPDSEGGAHSAGNGRNGHSAAGRENSR